MIHKCKCVHPYQDAKYGTGNRVFNKCKNGVDYRCTVCGNIITIGKAAGSAPTQKASKDKEKSK